MPTAYVMSESDAQVLRELVEAHRSGLTWPSRRHTPQEPDHTVAPDHFLGKTPAGGIAAGAVAECTVYLAQQTGGDETQLSLVAGDFTIYAYNPTGSALPGNTLMSFHLSREGRWVAVPFGSPTPESIQLYANGPQNWAANTPSIVALDGVLEGGGSYLSLTGGNALQIGGPSTNGVFQYTARCFLYADGVTPAATDYATLTMVPGSTTTFDSDVRTFINATVAGGFNTSSGYVAPLRVAGFFIGHNTTIQLQVNSTIKIKLGKIGDAGPVRFEVETITEPT
jgi:hypothetical protein